MKDTIKVKPITAQNTFSVERTNTNETEIWRSGYAFALILLFVIGVFIIAVGTLAFTNGSFWNVVFVNVGVAMAPSAVVAQFFRVFLFKEIKYKLTHSVLDEVRNTLGP